MMNLLIRIYRANPFRPHCNANKHVWLCRMLIAEDDCQRFKS